MITGGLVPPVKGVDYEIKRQKRNSPVYGATKYAVNGAIGFGSTG